MRKPRSWRPNKAVKTEGRRRRLRLCPPWPSYAGRLRAPTSSGGCDDGGARPSGNGGGGASHDARPNRDGRGACHASSACRDHDRDASNDRRYRASAGHWRRASPCLDACHGRPAAYLVRSPAPRRRAWLRRPLSRSLGIVSWHPPSGLEAAPSTDQQCLCFLRACRPGLSHNEEAPPSRMGRRRFFCAEVRLRRRKPRRGGGASRCRPGRSRRASAPRTRAPAPRRTA